MARSRRRRWPWLVAALALLAVGAWIAGLGDLAHPLAVKRPKRVRPTERSWHREHARLKMLPPAPVAKHARNKQRRPSDPLLTVLGGTHGALVLEANALWNEPVGAMLLKCLKSRDPGVKGALDEAKKKLHFDPIRQIDRIAVSPKHMVALSGFFKGVDFDAMFPDLPKQPYGDHAMIYEPPPGAGPSRQPYVAVWNDELILFGQSESDIEARIDSLEGRAARPPPPITPGDAYGDGYGVLPGSLIADALEHANPEVADRIRQAVAGARIHFDASGDVTLDAVFQPRDGADLGDLERSLAGSLAAARVGAQVQGKSHIADLLDDARVVPEGGGFGLDVQVPEKWAKQVLGNCAIFGPPPKPVSKPKPAP